MRDFPAAIPMARNTLLGAGVSTEAGPEIRPPPRVQGDSLSERACWKRGRKEPHGESDWANQKRGGEGDPRTGLRRVE